MENSPSPTQSVRPTPAAVIALVGRPNVGKSTLFNRLCRGRDALVADQPGLTRDRHYGHATLAGRAVTLIDTGGLTDERGTVFEHMATQVDFALREADLALLVTDARDGLTEGDREIARHLRRHEMGVAVAVNKIDGAPGDVVHEFAALGFADPHAVSAAHGRGIAMLAEDLAARLPDPANDESEELPGIRVAIVGRPNVGKSTLANRLVGAHRQVVHDRPGTTRDAIGIPFGNYLLIDTAGVRRKGRVDAGRGIQRAIEKFSIVKTLGALDRSEVAIVVVDGHEGIVDQDLHILDYAMESGAGAVLAVNKWDAIDAAGRRRAKAAVERRLPFAPWIPVRYLSGLTGRGVKALFGVIDDIHRAGGFEVTTSEVNRVLAEAVRDQPPPSVGARPIRLRYAHKGGSHPPSVVVHGTRTDALPANYRRYLANRYRDEFELTGVPVRIELRTSENPFAGRRNPLTRRQRKRRQRVIRHRS